MNPEQIKSLLILRKIKNKDISTLLGVNPSLISNVIHGRKKNKRVRASIAILVGKKIDILWPPKKKSNIDLIL